MNNTFKIFITVVFLLIVLFFWLFSRIKIEGLQKISKTSKEVSKIDGTEHRFIDEYDENGNKTNTKFIKIGLDREYTTPMNRR